MHLDQYTSSDLVVLIIPQFLKVCSKSYKFWYPDDATSYGDVMFERMSLRLPAKVKKLKRAISCALFLTRKSTFLLL